MWETSGPLPLPLQPPSRIPPFTTPTTPVSEVNYITAQWDTNETPLTAPFDLNTAVTEVILTKPQHFVRLFSPALGTSPNGVWIVRSSEARGLTPAQLKDRFALPYPVTDIVNVELPASPDPSTGKDYALWTGVAGPIAGFGNGGGVQSRIISDFNGTMYFPNYQFVIGIRNHPQPIGQYALSYQPMAGNGNAAKVAAYLDKYIPIAYSDLEDVYTDLDYINWVNYGPDPIREALNQISPEICGAIPFIITRNVLLFSNAVFEQIPCLTSCYRCEVDEDFDKCEQRLPCNLFKTRECDGPFVNLQALGEFINERKLGHHTSFTSDTGGAVGSLICPTSKNWQTGVSAAGMSNYVHYRHHRGNARIRTAKLGIYSTYFPVKARLPNTYLSGLLTGGYNWTKAKRSIEFYGVDRRAHSFQRGWDFSAHLRGGFSIPCTCWTINPTVGLSYFLIHQNSYKEHKAESLNLKVKGCNFQTLRSYLGFDACRLFKFSCGCYITRLELAWAHDCVLGNRSIHAGLRELGGDFSVVSYYKKRDSIIVGGMVSTLLTKNVTLSGRYDAELSSHFTSQSIKLSFNWNY